MTHQLDFGGNPDDDLELALPYQDHDRQMFVLSECFQL